MADRREVTARSWQYTARWCERQALPEYIQRVARAIAGHHAARLPLGFESVPIAEPTEEERVILATPEERP